MKNLLKIAIVAVVAVQLAFIYKPAAQEEDGIEVVDGDNLRTQTYKLVDKQLTTPYRKKMKDDEHRSKFSRCPSGLSAYINEVASTETEYSYGVLRNYVGCRPTDICHYRARVSDNTVEVLQTDSVNYMAVDLWLTTITASAE